MAIAQNPMATGTKVLAVLGVSYLGCCRLKKAQINAGPFGSLGDGPKIRGARQYG